MRSEQLDVKVLLKQVYLAHTTKIKGLEDGIEDLKSKLVDAERKLKNSQSDCKRCAELEEAFKGCQAALHEQSKWFENLGQKFSVFDHPESKVESNKIKETSNASKIQGGISNTLLSSFMPEKSSNVKQNLLKNLMSLSSEEYQDSLDFGTAPFPSRSAQDYSTLNSESMILAPDTMDVMSDIPLKNKGKDSPKHIEKMDTKVNQQNKTLLENIEKSKQVHNAVEIKESQLTNKPAKKRSLTGSAGSDSNTKKLHKSCVNESNCSPDRKNDQLTSKSVAPESISVDAKSLKDKKSLSKGKCREVKNTTLIPDIPNSKSIPCNDKNAKNKNISELTVEVCEAEHNISHKSTESAKDCLGNNVTTTVNNTMYQVSPSLLPLNDKDKILPVKLLENEDIYDFQTPLVSKKQHSEEGSSWTACDKKKLKKGALSLKLKSTSKFKMSLDALPPDYKKPTFRQTKLSKSIFLPKSSSTCEENLSVSSTNSSSAKKDNRGFNNVKGNGKTGTVDFDATCIPDNYDYKIIPSGSRNGKVLHEASENIEDIIVVDEESIDRSLDESSLLIKENYGNKSESKCYNIEKDTFEDFLQEGRQTSDHSEHMNSFDRLPKKKEPNYKYKEETVRKKADRKQLNAFDCKECEKYYAELGLTDKEKQERMKQCSRHRSKFAPPATPEHFWELEFPDTQECKARGYMNETQKGKLKTHRRKPL